MPVERRHADPYRAFQHRHQTASGIALGEDHGAARYALPDHIGPDLLENVRRQQAKGRMTAEKKSIGASGACADGSLRSGAIWSSGGWGRALPPARAWLDTAGSPLDDLGEVFIADLPSCLKDFKLDDAALAGCPGRLGNVVLARVSGRRSRPAGSSGVCDHWWRAQNSGASGVPLAARVEARMLL